MTEIIITDEHDIKTQVEASSSGDKFIFPDGVYNAGDEIIRIEYKQLTFQAENAGGAIIDGSFLIGASWETSFNGVDVRCQDGKQTIDARLSEVWFNDAKLLCKQGADIVKPLYLQHSNLYLRAVNRNLIFNWTEALKPGIIDMLYGSTVFAAGWGCNYIWLQCADQGQEGTILGVTQGGGSCYLHNVRLGGPSPAGEGNNVTCIGLQRDSSLRFLQDKNSRTGLGCQNAGVGVSMNSGSEAVLEGTDATGYGRLYMCNLGVGVNRFGPADTKDLVTRNINWAGTPPNKEVVVNSSGWQSF